MFGLTTTRRLRQVEAQRDANVQLLTEAYSALDTAQDHGIGRCITYRRRLDRALRAVARWRSDAARAHRETRLLAEQLLDATSTHNPAARHALGLPDEGPWQRAVEGLNALVDADVPFHIEPDGHISSSTGSEHIEWDKQARRFRLVDDNEAAV
ncbi:hypothetical protein [Streptomyces sp. PR69]|uniref:hypothetical protein n=1 Tax=Streptomyces sp. PR69 TaxID=2984950 RepID=UPI0022652EEF|nr:hypothetical protein [Streptomyces sp. PR69]